MVKSSVVKLGLVADRKAGINGNSEKNGKALWTYGSFEEEELGEERGGN